MPTTHECAAAAGEALASGDVERARYWLLARAALRDGCLTSGELVAAVSAR